MCSVSRIPIGTVSTGSTTSTLRTISFLPGLKLIGVFPLLSIGIVFLSLLGVAQYFVGLIQLLEFLLGRGVIGIQIGVIFASQLSVCFLNIVLSCVFIDA